MPTRIRTALLLFAALPAAVGFAVPAVAGASRGPQGQKPAPFFEGCMIGFRGLRSNRCLYGDPNGGRALFLFGDSHALQHFPALQVVARRRHWRLAVLTKADCTPGKAKIRNMKRGGVEYWQCDAWRRRTLRRIERVGARGIVAMSGHTTYRAFGPGGRALDGAANAAVMEAGYVATLRRLRRAGLETVVIRDTPEAPFDVPDCVAANIGAPGACAFPEPHDRNRDYDVRAARRVEGTGLIDLSRTICPRRLCHAVIGRVLVYRDQAHLNATYARTLSRRFEPALRRAARRSYVGIHSTP